MTVTIDELITQYVGIMLSDVLIHCELTPTRRAQIKTAICYLEEPDDA